MRHSPQPWQAGAGSRSRVFLLPWDSQVPPGTQEPRHSGKPAPYLFENCFSQSRKASPQRAHAVTPCTHICTPMHTHAHTHAHTHTQATHAHTHTPFVLFTYSKVNCALLMCEHSSFLFLYFSSLSFFLGRGMKCFHPFKNQ